MWSRMVRRVFEERVVFHAGDALLCPGVSLHHLPGHTPGAAGRARGYRPRPRGAGVGREPFLGQSGARDSVSDRGGRACLPESLRTLRKLAPSIDHIIPGHDPQVLARFPAEAGAADVVRLDLPPRPRAHS